MRKWAYATTALAGLAGGGGVILSAVAAHGDNSPLLQTAAAFLMVHAAAALGITAIAAIAGAATPSSAGWFLGAASFLLVGAGLFSADLGLRALHGSKLFAFAAPAGGVLMILGWAWTAAAAATAFMIKPIR